MGKAIVAEVKEVKWITTGTGIVKPLVALTKMHKRSGVEFDGVALEHAKQVDDFKINSGTKVDILVGKDKSLKIKKTNGYSTPLIPRVCSICQHELVNLNGSDLFCENIVCGAKSRTPIVKLIKTAFGSDKVEPLDIFNYINNFPINSEKSLFSLSSIVDFLHCFSTSGEKDTNFRDDLLKEVFKDKYEAIKEIETRVDQKLKNGITSKELWYIATIRGIDFNNIDEVSRINFNYTSRISYEQQVLELNLNKSIKQVLLINKTYMLNLLKYFNAYSNK